MIIYILYLYVLFDLVIILIVFFKKEKFKLKKKVCVYVLRNV